MRHKGLLIVAVAISAVAAVGYYLARTGSATQFLTQPVTRGDIVASIGATGTLEAVTTVQVGTQVTGTVLSLTADFNSKVRKGQVIARLDPALFQTQLDQARANSSKAEADLDRLRLAEGDAKRQLDHAQQLSANGLLAADDLATAQSNYAGAAAQVRSADAAVAQSRAAVQQAQVSLDKTVITSPISGIVIARNVDVGQTVAASLQAPTLFVVAADLTKMQVDASVHEADVGQVQPGQTVTFRVDAFPTEDFLGTVTMVRLNPIVQQNVVTYSTLIDVPNATLKLKPGMTATVSIRTAECQNVLRVPNAALRFRPSTDVLARSGTARPAPASAEGSARTGGASGVVWLLDNGRLTARRLVLGISDDNFTEVVEGDLDEGALVVTGVAAAGASVTPASSSTTNPLMGPQRGAPPRGGR